MSHLLRLSVAPLLLAAVACSEQQAPPSDTCPGPRPAFSLHVERADGELLPADTTLTVSYGGSAQERFALDDPPTAPQVVFCRVVPEGAALDGGVVDLASLDAGTHIKALVCELWTDGAANVSVEASGLAPFTQTLVAQTDECGITTTESGALLQGEIEPETE